MGCVRMLLLASFLFFALQNTCAQHRKGDAYRVVLLGNTADLSAENPFRKNLPKLLAATDTPTTIIVNGDIITGTKDPSDDSVTVQRLVSLVKDLTHVQMIVIPGDRDWADSGPEGWKRVKRLEKWVSGAAMPRVKWAIKDGCPGPKDIELGENILLIAIQTQWWNHPYDKPRPADGDCKITTENDFLEELEDLIDENSGKNILIAGHYPLLSYGNYGGRWPLSKYLLPLPIIGSFYPAFRRHVGTSKDISNVRFDSFRKKLGSMLLERKSLIYCSGHEHNLQILRYQGNYLVNSGAPVNPGFAAKGSLTLYSESVPGLVVLDYHDDGQVYASVRELDENNEWQQTSGFKLFQSDCQEVTGDTPTNTSYTPCAQPVVYDSTESQQAGTMTTVRAGKEYEAGKIKKFWLGSHYRDTWTTPVQVPYLNLDTTFNGLTPYQRGGGRQTTSLKFKAGDGMEYVFRSVNKDPVRALNYALRETIVADVVRDQTTTQQPYGALAADMLLNRIGILHAHPRLYLLPDDKKLGTFREDYANLFGMLEDRPTNPKKVEKPFAGADRILKSYRLFRELYEDHDHRVNDTEYARARVFDILVGDWGKHEDNWKWAGYKKNKSVIYRPIPRDRDHVFSLWDGVLPWLADREWAKPSGENFNYRIKGLRSLMWQARHMDRLLAGRLDRNDWKEAAEYVQQRIDDEVIDASVRNMPPEIFDISGSEIADKLKQRVKDLPKYADDYYKMLAKEVDIVGSNKRECFDVIRNADGTVEVQMCDLDKAAMEPDSSRQYFYRKFFPQETREIRLYGLRKADVFKITGKADRSIKVRVIGGPGADIIYDDSEVGGWGKKTLIYENDEDASLDLGSEARQVNHWNQYLYNYDRTAFAYDTYLPLPLILFNLDNGLGIGMGVEFTRQKFGKQDYASKHSISVGVTTERNNTFSYEGKWRHVIKKWDLTANALLANHYFFTFFFGIGNDTEKDDDLFDSDFYRTRYDSYQFTAGLMHDFWKRSSIGFQLHYENNAEQIENNTIVSDIPDDQALLGTKDTNIAEIIATLDLDFRNRHHLPQRGIRAFLQHQNGFVTSNSSDYGLTNGFLETYRTLHIFKPVTFGFKFGGSKSYGEVPFYKLKYLGQNNDLRGYLRNRFTGESTIFFNSELRLELSQFKTSIVPMKFGVKGFFDTGRVYSDFDLTNTWHRGYGAGFYLVPLRENFAINLSVAFSEEESGLVLFSIGKSFR